MSFTIRRAGKKKRVGRRWQLYTLRHTPKRLARAENRQIKAMRGNCIREMLSRHFLLLLEHDAVQVRYLNPAPEPSNRVD
jgi:hypothetical protein